MSGYVFQPKTITLVANVAQSIVWGIPEFYQHYGKGIIDTEVSVRFKVQNNTSNVIYLSLSYQTLEYSVPLQERQALAGVQAGQFVELSKATVPAIGKLQHQIQSITLTVIGAAAGSVQVSLVIDRLDELAASGGTGDLIGSSTIITDGYVSIAQFGNQVCNAASNNTIVDYTVPAGKRFYLDYISGSIPPVGAYPNVVTWTLYMPSPTIMFLTGNQCEIVHAFVPVQSLNYVFTAGNRIHVDVFNGSTAAIVAAASLFGREIF
jgi:hypothetical protein